MKSTYLEAKNIINGKPFDEIVNLPKIDERFSYGALNGSEGEGLVDLNFKDILVTVRNNNGVATIVNYEQYDTNGQFTDLVHTNESKTKKNTIKLNEEQLRKVVAECVKRIVNENNIWIEVKKLINNIIEHINNMYGVEKCKLSSDQSIPYKIVVILNDTDAEGCLQEILNNICQMVNCTSEPINQLKLHPSNSITSELKVRNDGKAKATIYLDANSILLPWVTKYGTQYAIPDL